MRKDERPSTGVVETLRLLEVTDGAVVVTYLVVIVTVSMASRKDRAEQQEAGRQDQEALPTVSLDLNGP